jgi:ferric-dicitrate binding protein FerR (iron transport regulator)
MIENGGRYDGYGIRELICDPYFQDWIIRPDADSIAFWNEWKTGEPGREALVREAAALLTSIGFTEELPSDEAVQEALSRSLGAIGRSPVRMAWRIAAIFVGVALCTGLYYYLRRAPAAAVSEMSTQYGENRNVYLPDSSLVILNAHSSIRYAPGNPREIWLDGEAYFDVRPQATSTFRVHAGSLSVEVLGTRFDIRDRRGKIAVVLESGKIRVRCPSAAVLMNPGEEVIYDTSVATLFRTSAVPETFTSWKEKRLTDVSVGEIAEFLEDNYHKTVILEDPAMAKRRIGGAILLDNLDDALFALSTVLNADIIQEGDTLRIRPK